MGCAWDCVCGIGRIIRELSCVQVWNLDSKNERGRSFVVVFTIPTIRDFILRVDSRDMPLLRSLDLLFSYLQIFRSYGAFRAALIS